MGPSASEPGGSPAAPRGPLHLRGGGGRTEHATVFFLGADLGQRQQGQQVGQRAFRPAVLVRAARRQPVVAPPAGQIHHGHTQVIVTEEPVEGGPHPSQVFLAAGGAVGHLGHLHQTAGVDGLLVEMRFGRAVRRVPPVVAHQANVSVPSGDVEQEVGRPAGDLQIGLVLQVLGRQPHRLRDHAVVVRQHGLVPIPVRRGVLLV